MKLFVYGTLLDNSGKPDHIMGDLYALSWFPGAINIGKSNEIIPGKIIDVDADRLADFDKYEGVASGLYNRVKTTTLTGEEVWVYEYGQELPKEAMKIKEWTRHG